MILPLHEDAISSNSVLPFCIPGYYGNLHIINNIQLCVAVVITINQFYYYPILGTLIQ